MPGTKIESEATSIVLFPPKPNERLIKTAIVLGVVRGGTSMAAGVVRGLGFYMGETVEGTNDDPDFTGQSMSHMRTVIRERNGKYKKWGWKYPGAGNYLDSLLPRMRNPHLVIVFRDLVAISLRHMRTHKKEAGPAISDVLLQTQKNVLLALRWRMPTLLVSYEKAVLQPDRFLDEMCDFLGEQLQVDRDKLIDYMKPGKYKPFEDVVSKSSHSNVDAAS